ncbi:unnamed protein product, partial [Meganyctiphanes norvegica]
GADGVTDWEDLQPQADEATSDRDSKELHRYAMEHGLWTPDPGVLVGGPEEEPPRRLTNAHFLTANNTHTTVQAGATAQLRCKVHDVADHETVSWIRLRDHHLITLGTQTYSNDDRFSVSFSQHKQEWMLHIKYAQVRDSGDYECQLSTHPPMGIIVTLNVIQALSEVNSGGEMYTQAGSTVKLVCRLRHYTEPPTYVFWYHQENMINYDSNRKVSVVNQGGESTLQLKGVLEEDSGNYTCVPSNAKPSSVTLHVITDEAPAAMQRASAPAMQSAYTLALAAFCLALVNL